MKKPLIFVMIIALLVCGTGAFTACGPTQNNEKIPPQSSKEEVEEVIQHSSNQSGTDFPPREDEPKDWNPKLDFHVVELIKAYERGEVEAFASSRGIELRNGRVLVNVESLPGQIEAAKQAALNAGARLGSGHRNSQDIIIPISNLTELSEEESIYKIELPDEPIEE